MRIKFAGANPGAHSLPGFFRKYCGIGTQIQKSPYLDKTLEVLNIIVMLR